MNYLEWIKNHGNPEAQRLMFGVIPAYPIFMFIGIILVIVASIIKLKLKGIPLREFELAILIVVPIGVIGASVFGKAFLPGVQWYRVFFFWEPGMSLFGSLLLGSTAGFVWFYRRSKKTLISVWVYADCIIPNILLGQVLGRWGNFYNHEILGQVVNYDDLAWLPGFIKNRLFYFPNLVGFELPNDWWEKIQQGSASDILNSKAGWGDFNGLTLEEVLTWTPGSPWLINKNGLALDPAVYNYGTILYRAPLFLIEGIGNLILWFFLTFVVANLGRWLAKPKPWDLEPKAYPGWYNKKYKSLAETDVISVPTQMPIKYKKVVIKDQNGNDKIQLRLGFYKAWNKAYYWYVPDQKLTNELEQAQIEWEKLTADNLKKLKTLKRDYRYQTKKLKNNYLNKTKRITSADQKQKLKISYQNDLTANQKNYQTKRQEIFKLIGNWTRIFQGNPHGKKLESINNPNHFFVIRSGVLSGAYVVGYLILRIILETQRVVTELMIPNAPIADFIILSLILIFGLAMIGIAQFVAPYRYREVNWLYEKSY